jgi:hypothetical protein
MAQLGFDATNVEPAAPRDILPAGKYVAHIIASEMKDTSKGGQYLNLEHEVIDGPHKGRRVWNKLNLVNDNATTVEIAQRQLSSICHAIGMLKVNDSEDLHYKPMLITVKVRPAGKDKQGIDRDAQNEVGGYEAANGVRSAFAPAAQPATSTPRPAPAAAGASAGGVPPWKKNRTAA